MWPSYRYSTCQSINQSANRSITATHTGEKVFRQSRIDVSWKFVLTVAARPEILFLPFFLFLA